LNRTTQTTRRARRRPDPTGDQFAAYGQAFDYFNRALFDGGLSRCLLNFSRHARSRGFFSAGRWRRGADHTHEISLNPDVLDRPLLDSMGTLVHEMVHLWQQEHGVPGRGRYHNKQWAAKMESVGLVPSHTGLPGGKRTGQGMTHYVLEGGRFDAAFRAMPPEYQLPWTSGRPADTAGPGPRDKVKYTCPTCGLNAWGKPGLPLGCMACDEALRSAE
jgi:hypothetical protein